MKKTQTAILTGIGAAMLFAAFPAAAENQAVPQPSTAQGSYQITPAKPKEAPKPQTTHGRDLAARLNSGDKSPESGRFLRALSASLNNLFGLK